MHGVMDPAGAAEERIPPSLAPAASGVRYRRTCSLRSPRTRRHRPRTGSTLAPAPVPLSAPSAPGSTAAPLPRVPPMPTRRRRPPELTSANVVAGVKEPRRPRLHRHNRPAGLCSSRTGGGESQPPVCQSPAHRQPPEAAPLRVATRRTKTREESADAARTARPATRDECLGVSPCMG